jgi:hypothetical protein
MFLLLSFVFYLPQNQRKEGRSGTARGRVLRVHWWETLAGGESGRRMNMVKIMYTHICKRKNDNC